MKLITPESPNFRVVVLNSKTYTVLIITRLPKDFDFVKESLLMKKMNTGQYVQLNRKIPEWEIHELFC